MTGQIFDLHCDLLSFLSEDGEKKSPMKEASRCSLPLLEKGGVSFQVLAVFTETKVNSRDEAINQLKCYKKMCQTYPLPCTFGLAIENASGLLEEGEPIELLFDRFDEEKWLYVSLTWKEENRFGGGDQTKVGLKEEGKLLLEYMDGKGTHIDLSHTSDYLAEDILNHIDKKGLKMVPIASHSNFRRVKEHPRNLPDDLAKEIIVRKGGIGINFVRHFVGDNPEDFIRHIEHGFSLGGEDALAIGADFFGGTPTPSIDHLKPFYQKPFSNSSCYPQFIALLEKHFEKKQVEKITSLNAQKILLSNE